MMQKKILLIKPNYEYYPMGLAYVASTLERNGIPYDYIDSYYDQYDLNEMLLKNNYFAIGSGGLVGDFFFLEKLFENIKAINPHMLCILGGHITKDVNYHLLFEKIPIDFAVVGEAENTLPQLLNRIGSVEPQYQDIKGVIYRGHDGVPVRNPKAARVDIMRTSIFPSFEFFDHTTWPINKLPIPVLTGRGCIGKCTYCSPSHRKFIPRPLEDIFTEVDRLVSRLNIKQIQFLNEVFFENEDDILRFCKEYKKRFSVPFCCVLRADFNPKILTELKDAGCVGFNIGIESGSNRILGKMKKHITVEQSRRFIKEAKRVGGFNITSGFMFGNEDETEEEIESTIQLHDELKIQSGVSPTIPYPGTALYQIARKRGLIDDEYSFLQHLDTMWHHEFRTDFLFLHNHRGVPILPNLTRIPNHRFVEVMQKTYLRLYSQYALAAPQLFVRDEIVWIKGKCPVCNTDVESEFDIQKPFLRGLCCPNVRPGGCYNNFEFYAHVFNVEAIKRYAEEISKQTNDFNSVMLCGDRLNIKFLLDHDIFKIKLANIVGLLTIDPNLVGHHLYENGWGQKTLQTRFYDFQALSVFNPDAVIIADMTPLSLELYQNIQHQHIEQQRIFYMCQPGSVPWPKGVRYYWKPISSIPKDLKCIIWPAGAYGRKLVAKELVPFKNVIAFVDRSPEMHGKTLMQLEVISPDALNTKNFDALIVASDLYQGEIVSQIRKTPHLVDKLLYSASAHLGFREFIEVENQ